MSVLITEPPGISALGNGSVFFLPFSTAIGGTASAPTIPVTAFASATNATCVLDAGWEPQYEPSAGSRMKYCSTAEYEVRGKGKWTGQNLQYEWDPQVPADVTNYKHVVDLAAGSKWKLALRLGLGKDEFLEAEVFFHAEGSQADGLNLFHNSSFLGCCLHNGRDFRPHLRQ